MKSKDNFVHWQIAAFLAALVLSNTCLATMAYRQRRAQIELNTERQAVYEEHVQQMQAWLARQQRVITNATDNYRADAYDPGIDRIAEQQLIAAEYQLLLLQVIAQQNAEMIELMMIAP